MQLVHATDNYALDQVNHNSNHMLKHNSNHMLNLSGDQPLLGDQRPGKKTIAKESKVGQLGKAESSKVQVNCSLQGAKERNQALHWL